NGRRLRENNPEEGVRDACAAASCYPRSISAVYPTHHCEASTMAQPRTDTAARKRTSSNGAGDTLTVTDNRTGKSYELPIVDGTVRAMDFRQMKTSADDFGLMTYDPAFTNTAACRSAITYIDGDKGILEYRGYPIEELAEVSNYLEVAWLLLHGELPTGPELADFTRHITIHTYLHENTKKLMEGFRHDAHPMGMLL